MPPEQATFPSDQATMLIGKVIMHGDKTTNAEVSDLIWSIGRDRVVIADSPSPKGRIECFAQIHAARAGRRRASGLPVRGYCRRTAPRIAVGAKAARLAVP